MNVEANDPDIDTNLEYSVIGNILPSDKSENLENIKAPPFLLDKNSGDIILNFDPQKGMKFFRNLIKWQQDFLKSRQMTTTFLLISSNGNKI